MQGCKDSLVTVDGCCVCDFVKRHVHWNMKPLVICEDVFFDWSGIAEHNINFGLTFSNPMPVATLV
jgi:hypothetical protein